MSVTVTPKALMTFLPKGTERVKPGPAYLTFVPKGAARVRIGGSYLTFSPGGAIRVKVSAAFLTFAPAPSEVTATADTERNISESVKTTAGAFRGITKTETAIAAATRFVQDRSEPIVVEAPAERDVFSLNTVPAGVRRELFSVQTASARAAIQSAVMGEAVVSFRRTVYKTAVIPAETARRIPHVLPEMKDNPLAPYTQAGIQSLSITLGERTLSDTFQMATVKPLSIEDEVNGVLLDYPYRFLVEETSQKDLLQTVKGMYSVDALLYTPFQFPKTEHTETDYYDNPESTVVIIDIGRWSSTYAEQIASALGLKLAVSYEDYQMSQDYTENQMTYRDIVSALFGWTSRVPQRQINVFIRGDTLHILQRGMEENVLDISSWPHTRPQINRKLIRSLWSSSGQSDDDSDSNKAHSDDEPMTPFTGIIGVGKVTLRYENGYLVSEKNHDAVTTYEYDGEYLSTKKSHNVADSGNTHAETSVETKYEYCNTGEDVYLVREVEVTTTNKTETSPEIVYDAYGPQEIITTSKKKTIATRNTYHAPIGGGWYMTSVYTDNKFEGSTLSQGPPGGKASQYMVDKMNRNLHKGVKMGGPVSPGLSGKSLIDTSFPVKGDVILRELTEAIEWLNRKTQEDVTLEIVSPLRNGKPDITHVVDFTERVRLDGHEYFLVSNNIELTPRSLRQKLKLVRWYG